MTSVANEVDGTGTVDVSSSAAERLKHNQATGTTTTTQNEDEQVTIMRYYRTTDQSDILKPINNSWRDTVNTRIKEQVD